MQPVHVYFASSGTRAEKVMAEMKGKGRQEGYDQVVVKKEAVDDGEVVEVAAKKVGEEERRRRLERVDFVGGMG